MRKFWCFSKNRSVKMKDKWVFFSEVQKLKFARQKNKMIQKDFSWEQDFERKFLYMLLETMFLLTQTEGLWNKNDMKINKSCVHWIFLFFPFQRSKFSQCRKILSLRCSKNIFLLSGKVFWFFGFLLIFIVFVLELLR